MSAKPSGHSLRGSRDADAHPQGSQRDEVGAPLMVTFAPKPDTGLMTTSQTSSRFVTRTDKEGAKQHVSELFTSGQITADEYGRRLHEIDRSEDWGQLRSATTATQHAIAKPTGASATTKDWAPFLIHLSGAWALGAPLVAWFFLKDPVLKREAAKAFNFQLLAFVVMVVVGIGLGWMNGFDRPIGAVPEIVNAVLRAAAAVIGVIAGIVTLNGNKWTYPVNWFGKRGPLNED